MYTDILIRYGELMIKGKNRKKFIRMLEQRLQEVFCDRAEVIILVNPTRAFLTLQPGVDVERIIAKLETVFGIASVSLAIKVPTTLEEITTAAINIANFEIKETQTFKVETKRVYKPFPMESLAVTKHVSAAIFQAANKPLAVDVYKPNCQLLVEIRKGESYVMLDKIKMAGGLPQGSSGKAVLMLSGGIDSPVSAYLAMKKGIEIIAVHFASPPYTSDKSLEKVKKLIRQLEKYQAHIPLYVVPFTEIQLSIVDSYIQEGYHMVIMRRLMYRITEKIAEEHSCVAIINGESVGQVASQTLGSMRATHVVVGIPIIQPLAMFEKNEIIKIAEKIGTYEISILPFEDCCTVFVPKKPTTNPNRYISVNQEKLIDFEKLIIEAVEKTEKEGEIAEINKYL
ncbi:MAG: tRNA uracil 4-sulfurtransferase ThiI [Culicoidibacterales bacterium]